MLAKVFLKRRKGGAFVRDDLEYSTHYYEADRIMVGFSADSSTVYSDSFTLYFDNDLPSGISCVNFEDKDFGFEIMSSNGTIIERHVVEYPDREMKSNVSNREEIKTA
jgi:hypothetical protein